MYKKYLRTDGTMTDWIISPENDTDREIFILSPLTRRYATDENVKHLKYGLIKCVKCELLENEDQCGDWDGPSFIGYFI